MEERKEKNKIFPSPGRRKLNDQDRETRGHTDEMAVRDANIFTVNSSNLVAFRLQQ